MVKRALYFLIPATVVTGLLLVTTGVSTATQAYTKKEKKGCTYCHVGVGKKELNEVGKCYAEHNHTLDSCETKK